MEVSSNKIRGFFLLAMGVIINSLAVAIYVESNLGVSTVSSIPLVMSRILPNISLGMATILFQTLLILILCVLYKPKMSYFASLFFGVFLGGIVDAFSLLLTYIPLENIPNIFIFSVALLLLPFGITLTIRSNLTSLPFDIIISEISLNQKIPFSKVKLWFDIICVIITLILSLVFLKSIVGIGVGTIVSMFLNAKIIQFYMNLFPERLS